MSEYDSNSINMSGLGIRELEIGRKASFTKTITDADIYGFAGITCDFNPMHVNEEYAKKTRFGGRIAHGMLSASFISTVLGMSLPGAGAIYLGQSLRFTGPVRIGDTITAEAEIIRINEEKKIVVLHTAVKNQRNEIVVEGEATLLAGKD